jgi:thiosulfate/3-mercaptopyruvate sulfurtransferase
MKSKISNRLAAAFLVAAMLACAPRLQCAQANVPKTLVAVDGTIPPSAMMQPEELVTVLKSPTRKPPVLQVGSHVMYAQAHIPGSEYVGAANTAAGLAALRKRVATLNKNEAVILYCGCCPWVKCPNIRPAFKQLQSLGYMNVKVLYLADNFGTDWVNKGFPVEAGQ